MTVRRFILCPGWVISRSDGQEHFISAAALADLYRVDIRECYIRPATIRGYEDRLLDETLNTYDLPNLCPRFDGDYSIPG